MEMQQWYLELIRPEWAPPTWLFGPVWAVLYIIIFISFSYVFTAYLRGQLDRWIALPFLLNIIFNLLFTPIQFGLKSNLLAAIDIVLVLVTLIWALVVVYPYRKWVALVNIPYLLWVSFATILQLTITYLNW
jgi:tryptophan-rich sensory protein